WSPDFSRIAFIVTAGTSPNEISDLYVMNADGTGITNLTDGAPNYEVMSLKWASDGSRIFFLFRAGGSDVFDIGSIGPDKTGFANLTNVASMGADVSVVPPGLEISRDGTKLAYAAGNLGDLTILPIDIYVMNIDGTSNTKITAAAPGSVAWYPTFSPDGKKICYGSGAGAAGIGLSAVNVDGSGQQTIVPEEAGRIIIPWAYSPDGTQLITMFLFDVGGDTVPDVYLVSADGATLTRLTNSSGTNQGWAGPWAWSPDGTKVAYIYDDMDNGPVNLYVANRDGSGVRDITGFTGGTLVFAHPLFMELGLNVAQWFDDGTQMAFTQMVNTGTPTVTSANVALAKTDGSAVTPLTNMTAPQIAVFVAWR
ncbi:MAG: DPP IV N-terminal domain-containing protein, partial [bacterium]